MFQSLKKGALIGTLAGAMMAMFAMIAAAAAGDGFWAPVNAIAHTAWHGAPLDGHFALGALMLGMLIHMAIAMMLGVSTVAALSRMTNRPGQMITATAVAAGVWLVQIPLWNAIDSTGAHSFHGWILFLGHVIFGMTVGLVVVRSSAQHQSAAAQPALAPT